MLTRLVIRYSNRVEIRNAGFSLKARENLGEPGSLQRNPRIAAVLYDTRFAETKGSGIRVMRDAMRQAGLTPPLFESDRGQDLFVARYAFHHFLGPDDLAWLAGFKALHLSEAGLLAQKGRGSATYYVPTPGLLPPDDGTAALLSSKPGPLSSKFGLLSGDMDTTAGDADSDDTASSAAARDKLLAAVLALCALRAWRAEELAKLLQRNVEYTRQNHLRPLVREARLARAYPQEPHHPQQAYRAVAVPWPPTPANPLD